MWIIGQGEMNSPDMWEEQIVDGCCNYSINFKNVKISSGITNVPERLVTNNTVENIVIPSTVKSIGWGAFARNQNLSSITIPNGVTSISDGAFGDCTNLSSITIPNSVTTIGANAFCECTGLTSVTIPNSVKSIGYHAFTRCTGLSNITIPSSVTSMGNYVFYGCRITVNVPFKQGKQPDGWNAEWNSTVGLASDGGIITVNYVN